MVIFSAQLSWDVLGGGFGMLLLCFTDAVLFLLWGRVGTSHSASWGRAFPLGWGSGVTPRDGSYQYPTPANVIPGVPVTHQASLVSVCVTRTTLRGRMGRPWDMTASSLTSSRYLLCLLKPRAGTKGRLGGPGPVRGLRKHCQQDMGSCAVLYPALPHRTHSL